MELDYEKDVKIDESALDVEWLNQASLAMRYGKYWAKCSDALDKAEESLKIVVAELQDKVNANPEKCLGEGVKTTVSNVEGWVIKQEKYRHAKEDVRAAKYELSIANIAKNEISNTRKSALENLVRLHGQSYFASPSAPRDLSIEAQKARRSKEADKGVASAMQRRKKRVETKEE
jgi:hypothetical protein